MSTSPKRLYRSRTNRFLAGVCGGIAEYLDIDPALVRVVWVLLTIFGGWGIILYVAAMIIVPLNPSTSPAGTTQPSDATAAQLLGILLVVLGCFFLLVNLDVFSFHELKRLLWNYALPASLIGAGIFLLLRRSRSDEPSAPPPATPDQSSDVQEKTTGRAKRKSAKQSAAETQSAAPASEPAPPPVRRLLRSTADRKLFGVCGGLGEYFDIDPTFVRILFVIFTLMSFGFGILVYLVLLLSMPERPRPMTT
jgi:phage shock protein C